MNKKYLALLLAVSLGLVACGGSDSSDPIVETPDQSGEDSDEEADDSSGDEGESSAERHESGQQPLGGED